MKLTYFIHQIKTVMDYNETPPQERKSYQTPELKELGKIGEITNSNPAGVGAIDGGAQPGYVS